LRVSFPELVSPLPGHGDRLAQAGLLPRPSDLPQRVLCVAVNATGWPIAWEIFPGNTADQKALGQVVAVLRERFRIRRVTVVADRGMISRDTITMLTEHQEAPFDYVLGCRMRRQKEVNEEVLARAGRYQSVTDNLEVKEVRVGGRRYVVCRNPQEAARDAAAREAKVSWPDLMRDLGQVQSVLVELDGQRYQLRTDLVGAAHHAFAAAGVRPPSPVTRPGPVS
jgi:hypothetical protein